MVREKEKMLMTSIFSFSYPVFNKSLLRVHQKSLIPLLDDKNLTLSKFKASADDTSILAEMVPYFFGKV